MQSGMQPSKMKCLHLVSIFPAQTETFIFREIRALQDLGCEVVIGQLRPVGRRPTASDVEDLRGGVLPAKLLSWSTLAGFCFFAAKHPKTTWSYIKLVLGCFPDIKNLLKLAYVFLASVSLAYRLRDSGIRHVRGHHLHSEAVSAMFVAGFLELPYSFKVYTVKVGYPRAVLRQVVNAAAFIIADTLQVREFLISLGADPGKIHILRNAVRLSEFPMRPAGSGSEPVILAVGRLDYKKGFHVLLSACALLRDQGIPFHCVIVGDGDQRTNLQALRAKLHLEEQVEMAGSLGFSEVRARYLQATLLAVPSVVAPDGETDGLPTVTIEAFAYGVPVVGSATAGIPEVIHDHVNGFVVPANSPEELARRMKDLLTNPALRNRFAAEGRRTAERDFDLDRNAQTLFALMRGEGMIPAPTAPAPVLETLSSAR
jgi:colanic acid/amylovoran biosynthesis glycosyltransferase